MCLKNTIYGIFLMWNKIEKQLKIKGWSMYRLAKESGVHPSNFSNLKAGRLKEMSWIKRPEILNNRRLEVWRRYFFI